jgi:hypothetical protein
MNGKTLLETYPKAADVVKQHFTNKLLESLNNADLPDDFKEFAKQQEIDNDKIGELIDSQPRGLFDVFDENQVYVEITVVVGQNTFFIYHVNGVVNNNPPYHNRKEAEIAAIETAFQVLNDKL